MNRFLIIPILYIRIVSYRYPIYCAGPEIRNNKELMMFCCHKNPPCLALASEALKRDKDLLWAALKVHYNIPLLHPSVHICICMHISYHFLLFLPPLSFCLYLVYIYTLVFYQILHFLFHFNNIQMYMLWHSPNCTIAHTWLWKMLTNLFYKIQKSQSS